MKKQMKTTETKKIGSFTVTPKFSGSTVWFNFNNRGRTARYDLATGEFKPCKGRVGRMMESQLEVIFIEDAS